MVLKKYLVTGGAGFIGSHITGRLLSAGHEVICLDSFDTYYDPELKEQNIRPFLGMPGFSLIRGDILDERVLKKAFPGVDCIFHLAARPGIRGSIVNPITSHEVNATGTLMVLREACRAGVKKVVFSSSSSIYGNAACLPTPEGSPYRPISPYGVSKLCAEDYCDVYRRIYGLETVILRYFTVYGPRMRPDLAISIFVRSALAGKNIDIFGDGEQSRDFTYIDDAVGVSLIAAERGSGIYNIGSGRPITINDLTRAIIGYTGSKSHICYRKGISADAEHTLADITRARTGLGYRPETVIAEGIKRYIDYVTGTYREPRPLSPIPISTNINRS
jgi:UDP-glucose 4-epimerase